MSVPRQLAVRLAVWAPTRCWEQPAQRGANLSGMVNTGKQVWAPLMALNSLAFLLGANKPVTGVRLP